jgi:Fic family protein
MSLVSEGSTSRGEEITVEWNGTPVRAWLPHPLAGRVVELGIRTARRTEQAAAAAVDTSARSSHVEPLALLLRRAEGVASSFIEGLRTPLVDIAAAEIGATANETAISIAQNLDAVTEALGTSTRPMGLGDLHAWHRRLMGETSALPDEMVGAFRSAQSWIGGTSPRDAAFVPPPADRVADLMEDLVAFVGRVDLDPVTQAAMAHAQFETIHPYGDGNGRIGRILIGWILARRLRLALPPPISVVIARDPGGYLSGLTMYRMGQLDHWVEWVASALLRSSAASHELVQGSEALLGEWRARASGVRADSAVHRAINLLAQHPMLSADVVARDLGVSERAARDALAHLARLGIVEDYAKPPTGVGRPRRYWMAGELITLLNSLSVH